VDTGFLKSELFMSGNIQKPLGLTQMSQGSGLKGEVFEKLLGAYEKNMHLSFLCEYVNPKSITILET